MLRIWGILLLAITIFSCGSSDKTEKAGAPINDNEFTRQFDVLKLRFTISDTALDRMDNKNAALKVFGGKYFPDELIKQYFTDGNKISYYPIGKVQNDTNEIYVVMKAVSATRKAAYVLVYDNKLNYMDGSMICQTDGDRKTSYLSTIDKFFNITIRRTDIVPDQDPVLTEVILGYNGAGKLGQLVTNDTDAELGILNPIDTLPATKKYTGDYYMDNSNMVSFRDSKDSGTLNVYYVFEKGPDCTGFIKDKVKFITPTQAVYKKDGDPCGITFDFTNTSVKVTEGEGCGNKKMSFECTLNGMFAKQTKKREAKVAQTVVVNPLGAPPPPVASSPSPAAGAATPAKQANVTNKPKPAKTTPKTVAAPPSADGATAPPKEAPKAAPKPSPPPPKKPLKQPDFK